MADNSPTLNQLVAEMKEHTDQGIMRVGKEDGQILVIVAIGEACCFVVNKAIDAAEDFISQQPEVVDSSVIEYHRTFGNEEGE